MEKKPTLFGTREDHVEKASVHVIGKCFNERLRTLFAGVAGESAVLRNSGKSPLYLLCFAAANEKGAPIALRIA